MLAVIAMAGRSGARSSAKKLKTRMEPRASSLTTPKETALQIPGTLFLFSVKNLELIVNNIKMQKVLKT